MSSSEEPSSDVRTDLDQLAKRIRLPYRPTEGVWQAALVGTANAEHPGRTDWCLTAILAFTEADAEKLVAEASRKSRPPAPSVKLLDWFPPDIKEHRRAAPADDRSRHRLTGELYDATAFMKPPLRFGFLARIAKKPRFLLRLHTL